MGIKFKLGLMVSLIKKIYRSGYFITHIVINIVTLRVQGSCISAKETRKFRICAKFIIYIEDRF